jgi:bis(5'-nucleosyl)-tetraphosphatase (symmetrical)
MSTYVIGDIQGCFDALQSLLEKISFTPQKDTLWFAGDLVNRGDKSLETLRYVKSLGDRAICVLGNHDLSLLALSEGCGKSSKHTMQDVLTAPDRDELILWLRRRPLLHHDEKLGYTMVHAGLPPQWDLETTRQCAGEMEEVLQGDEYHFFMANIFGNEPRKWDRNLKGLDRFRFIINCFTRMRYCTPDGRLNFSDNGPVGSQKKGYLPWYEIEGRKSSELKIVFGHWSALMGRTSQSNVFALDTGCLWGGGLTAMRLDLKPEFYTIKCDTPDPGFNKK